MCPSPGGVQININLNKELRRDKLNTSELENVFFNLSVKIFFGKITRVLKQKMLFTALSVYLHL